MSISTKKKERASTQGNGKVALMSLHMYNSIKTEWHRDSLPPTRMPNSVTVYPRVKGHIRFCQSNHWTGTFVDFVDKVPSVEQ
jgi:hypothetical protein